MNSGIVQVGFVGVALVLGLCFESCCRLLVGDYDLRLCCVLIV